MPSWGVNMTKLSCHFQCLYVKPGYESQLIWPFVLQQHPETSSHSENVLTRATLAWSALLENKVPGAQAAPLRPAYGASAGGVCSGTEVCVCRPVPRSCTGDQVHLPCARLSSAAGVGTTAVPPMPGSPQGRAPSVYRVRKRMHKGLGKRRGSGWLRPCWLRGLGCVKGVTGFFRELLS